jgi:hypothetical protein
MNTKHPCPACGVTLCIRPAITGCPALVAYCADGRCGSLAANEGGFGDTAQEATEDLAAAVEREAQCAANPRELIARGVFTDRSEYLAAILDRPLRTRPRNGLDRWK